MNYNLFRKDIDGWIDIQTSGIPEFKISPNGSLSGFVLWNAIMNFVFVGSLINPDSEIQIFTESGVNYHFDYLFTRDRIEEYVSDLGGFSSIPTDEEKDIVLANYTKAAGTDAGSLAAIIGYLMAKYTISQQQAQYMYMTWRNKDVTNAAKCFDKRARSPINNIILSKHMEFVDMETYLSSAGGLLRDLCDAAVIGTEYGNSRDGWADYMNGTGGYSGMGFQDFFATQELYEAARDEVLNWVLYGITVVTI